MIGGLVELNPRIFGRLLLVAVGWILFLSSNRVTIDNNPARRADAGQQMESDR
jgi:hypothetical protein